MAELKKQPLSDIVCMNALCEKFLSKRQIQRTKAAKCCSPECAVQHRYRNSTKPVKLKNCKKCGIELKGLSQLKFCSKSCSASFNNVINPKRKLDEINCKSCKSVIPRKTYLDPKRVYCNLQCQYKGRQCNPRERSSDLVKGFYELTLEEVRSEGNANTRSRVPTIRVYARGDYMKSDRPKCCEACGYDTYIEIAHIKAIKDTPAETLISEINDLSNLYGLCRNCHWELDHGHEDKIHTTIEQTRLE